MLNKEKPPLEGASLWGTRHYLFFLLESPGQIHICQMFAAHFPLPSRAGVFLMSFTLLQLYQLTDSLRLDDL